VADLDAIFKAYDVRGLVPSQLDEPASRLIGSAFATVVLEDLPGHGVVVGYDMRSSSPGLCGAFVQGVRDMGADVTMIGLAATEQLYFASGWLDLAGAMVTASHNPAGHNGIKLCRPGAVPLAKDTGLAEIKDLVVAGRLPAVSPTRGRLERRDVLAAYADHLHSLAPLGGRRLRVVVDAANGMAGHTVPAVFAALDVELIPMYFELDGTFPNHVADPLDPANLVDLRTAVVSAGADVGLAFDGDADRCFAVDERGQTVPPSAMTSLIAVRELEKEPGATIIHNVVTSRAVPETIRRHGGKPVRTRVGHSLVKARMAETGAVFGGEHSGHFYFRDFWCADSGMLAALHVLGAVSETDRPLSELVAEYSPYAASGEINLVVPDTAAVMDLVAAEYGGDPEVEMDRLDGLTVTGKDWWFNVRPSNTEPLLRLNVEAATEGAMSKLRDHVLSLMRRDK
jgi:phosphomannomutase